MTSTEQLALQAYHKGLFAHHLEKALFIINFQIVCLILANKRLIPVIPHTQVIVYKSASGMSCLFTFKVSPS